MPKDGDGEGGEDALRKIVLWTVGPIGALLRVLLYAEKEENRRAPVKRPVQNLAGVPVHTL